MAGPSMKVKKGDTVMIRSGKDRGTTGRVLLTLPKVNRVLVEGVNRVKKHTKVVQQGGRGGTTGGIITTEAPVHVSNVMVVDSDGKPTRVGYRVDDSGQKVRISRRSKKDL